MSSVIYTSADDVEEAYYDAIGRGDQNRVLIAGGARIEERAETAQTIHHPGTLGRGGSGLDPLDQRIAGIDIHSGLGIGQAAFALGHLKGPLWFRGPDSAGAADRQ